MDFGDLFGELEGVGNSGGQEDVLDFVGKEDDGFFLDYIMSFVVYVMDFIEDDLGNFVYDFGILVQYGL